MPLPSLFRREVSLEDRARATELYLQNAPSLGATQGMRLKQWIHHHVRGYKFYRWNNLLIEYLEKLVHGDLSMLFVFCPPRHGKSELVSRILPAYYLYLYPDRWAAISSYNANLAATFSRAARARFNLPLSPEQQAAMSWETLRGGGMWAAGVGGTQTGKGFHLGICDDPVKDADEAASPTIQERNRDWWDTVWTTRQEPEAVQLLTMTRWHGNDVAGHVLRSRKSWEGAAVLHLPAIAEPREHIVELYHDMPGLEIAPDWREPGAPLCPARYPLEDLYQIRKRLTDYYWSALYQQRPSVRGGAMFPRAKAHLIPESPIEGVRMRLRYWDKAGTQGGGAYTAGVKLALLYDGLVVVEDVVRGQWAMHEREQTIRTTAILDGPRTLVRVEQEPGSGGKDSADATIRNLIGFKVAADRPTGDKTLRAEPIADRWQGGNVRVVSGAWNAAFLSELEMFPSGTYRDQVDALSGAYKCLMELVSTRRLVGPVSGDRYPVFSV